eukprot:1802784-Prymnesium_polylepis.1
MEMIPHPQQMTHPPTRPYFLHVVATCRYYNNGLPHVTCSCVAERYAIMAALLTGDCAARGVRVRARESLPTGVSASFGLR